MNELRIALFTGNYNHIKDGVSLTLNRLVGYLEENGVKVLVFGPSIKEPALKHNGTLVEVPSVAAPGREEYRISLFLPEVHKLELESFDPHLIHIATPDILGFAALRYALRHNVPLVASYHTHFQSYLEYYGAEFLEPLLIKYLKWFYSKCHSVFVPTESMIEVLLRHGFDANFRIWARGVDTSLFNPKKRDMEFRRGLGIGDDEAVVCYVSRLAWEKGLRSLIDTGKLVLDRDRRVRILIVGDGPAMAEMKNEFPEAIYTGFVFGDELARVYASSDVFFFPSITETFGNVVLEAMASGLPAVVADATGSKSLVVDGVTGLISGPKNPEDFANNILKIAGDAELRQKMSKNAHERAGMFEWNTILGQLLTDLKIAAGRKNHPTNDSN